MEEGGKKCGIESFARTMESLWKIKEEQMMNKRIQRFKRTDYLNL